MSTVDALISRIRRRFRDTGKAEYSSWELIEAVNDAVKELRTIVLQFYNAFNFTVPADVALTNTNNIGWPTEFDSLIIDYVIYHLTMDGVAFEQMKSVWQSKAIALAGTMSTDSPIVKSYFDTTESDTGKKNTQSSSQVIDGGSAPEI